MVTESHKDLEGVGWFWTEVQRRSRAHGRGPESFFNVCRPCAGSTPFGVAIPKRQITRLLTIAIRRVKLDGKARSKSYPRVLMLVSRELSATLYDVHQ
jgi:hypothetical protein